MSDHAAAMGADDGLPRCPLMPTYGAPSVLFVRGQGTELWDRDGRRYLDFISGLGVTGLGHAHPTVAEAIAWHGGEGEVSREAFRKMNRADREALIAFVLDL